MKTIVKSRSLSLREASWVDPFSFDAQAKEALAKWLTPGQLDELRATTEFAISATHTESDEPNFAEQRNLLVRAAELATELALILERAPATTSAKFSQVFQQNFGDAGQKRVFAKSLLTLAGGTSKVWDTVPEQSRRKSPVFFVSQIAEVLNAAGIKTSVSEGSRFYKICQIVFDSAGIFQSPAAPIRVFLKSNRVTKAP